MSNRFEDIHEELPRAEQKLLNIQAVQSGVILIALSFVLAYVMLSAISEDPLGMLTNFYWFTYFTNQLLPYEPLSYLGFIIAPALMVLVSAGLNKLLQRRSRYGLEMTQVRQGIMGEMIAMDLKSLLPSMAFGNFSEELLFRATLIPVLTSAVVSFGVLVEVATVIALVVSVVLFGLSHFQYRNFTSFADVCCGGLLLALWYLLWGSVLICFVAHIAYNVFSVVKERELACSDPDYFGGKQPLSILSDLVKRNES